MSGFVSIAFLIGHFSLKKNQIYMNVIFLFLATQPYHLKYLLNDKFIYNLHVTVKEYLRVFSLDHIAVAMSWKVGPVKLVNHTSWVAIVTPTDRPKSVRNCCVIELFGNVSHLLLSFFPFDISAGVGAFVIGLNQISFFIS